MFPPAELVVTTVNSIDALVLDLTKSVDALDALLRDADASGSDGSMMPKAHRGNNRT